MSHSKVGQDFRDILMNDSDADDAKTDQHFDGHAATNSKMANEIERMEVLKQFVIDQRSANVKEMGAALNLARSSDKNVSLVRIPVNSPTALSKTVLLCPHTTPREQRNTF